MVGRLTDGVVAVRLRRIEKDAAAFAAAKERVVRRRQADSVVTLRLFSLRTSFVIRTRKSSYAK